MKSCAAVLLCLITLTGCLSQNLEGTLYLSNTGKADVVFHFDKIEAADPSSKLADEQQWLMDFKTDSLPIQKHLIAAGVRTRERYLIRGISPFAAVFTAELDSVESAIRILDPEGRHLQASLSRLPNALRLEISPRAHENKTDQENQEKFFENLKQKSFRLRFVPLDGKIRKVEGLIQTNDAAYLSGPATEWPKMLLIEWETSTPNIS